MNHWYTPENELEKQYTKSVLMRHRHPFMRTASIPVARQIRFCSWQISILLGVKSYSHNGGVRLSHSKIETVFRLAASPSVISFYTRIQYLQRKVLKEWIRGSKKFISSSWYVTYIRSHFPLPTMTIYFALCQHDILLYLFSHWRDLQTFCIAVIIARADSASESEKQGDFQSAVYSTSHTQ